MKPIDTREAWLGAALTRITAGWPVNAELPENVRISVGFPVRTSKRAKPGPVTFYVPKMAAGGMIEMFVSPTIGESVEVCRAIAECAAVIATGRDVSDDEREALNARADKVARTLPVYPHIAIPAPAEPAPGEIGSRYVRTACGCGYTMRVTRKWLTAAIPQCPLGHGPMRPEIGEP